MVFCPVVSDDSIGWPPLPRYGSILFEPKGIRQLPGVAPCLRQLMAAHGLMDCTACLAVVRSGALAVEYRRLAAIECGVVIRVINSDEAHHRRRPGRCLMRSASAAGAPLDREWARSVVVVVVVVLMLRYRAHALVDLGGVEQIVLRQ